MGYKEHAPTGGILPFLIIIPKTKPSILVLDPGCVSEKTGIDRIDWSSLLHHDDFVRKSTNWIDMRGRLIIFGD